MNQEIMEFCKIEINDLLGKKIITHSKSPWSCPAFYVKKKMLNLKEEHPDL